MPQIKLNKIKEFSSEDVANNNIANNMLRTKEYKSWKCNEWQSISYVIFELSEPTLIDNIEIGNDCSAFVEVLVSNSNAITQRYQVLLSTSSFMTPSESHSLTNCNRVRVFNKEKLSPNASNEKWDLIKIVCTQPFNKTISYGLSFIRLNSPLNEEEGEEEMEANSASLNIGPFKLNDNNEEQESKSLNRHFTAGSLFAKRSNTSNNESSERPKVSSLASAVGLTHNKTRDSSQISSNTSNSSVKPKQKTSQTIPSNQTRSSSVNTSSISSTNTTISSLPQRANPSPHKKLKKTKTIPFNQLMSKVIFALSGYKNPKRAELRTKACEMGAKYRADWDRSCTHLICAFANTPKFEEAKSNNGRIVKQNWIEDSYAQKSLLPWRSYMLGRYNGPDSAEESEEEVIDSNRVQYIDADEDESPQSQSHSSNQLLTNSSQTHEIIGFGNNSNVNDSKDLDIDMNDDIYDAETDSESNADNNSQSIVNLKQLNEKCDEIQSKKSLDIFKDKYFHFYGSFDEKEKETLNQLITSYGGKLEENMTSSVKFVITNSNWNQDFEEACAMNESLIFVKPKWIHRCHQNSKLVPYQPFVVSCNYD